VNLDPILLELLLFSGGLILFFTDLFVSRKRIVGYLALLFLLVVLGVSFLFPPKGEFFKGFFISDSISIFLKKVFLLAGILGTIGVFSQASERFSKREGEYYILLFFTLLGMFFLVSSRDLLLLFVSFELMSLPLYVLAGFLKEDERSVEASLKYFIFGSFSSAILLMGISMLYATTGTTKFKEVATFLKGSTDSLLFLSFFLLVVGFGFKIAIVPFHMWVPDTYEGAPTPFVAFLSVAPKVAGFGIIFRVFFEILSKTGMTFRPYISLFAAITMIVGNLLAIPQRNIKRLLSYSGIAHIGYMLLGLASGTELGIGMSLFYFVAYLFSNMGAFICVDATYRSEKSDNLEAYHGISQRAPLLALSMLLYLLSLGGIPFVVGFWAKLYIFLAAAKAGLLSLVVLGAVLTVVALFYYLNVARKLYIEKPVKGERIRISPSTSLVLVICSIAVVVLGILPSLLATPALEAAKGFLGR